MPYSTAGKNKMLNALAPATLSLHSADPGDTGASELSGGSPAYARKAASYGAASGGSKASSAAVTFDVPAGATVAYVGHWDSSSVWLGGDAVTQETFAGQGTYTVDTDTLDLNS